jgi:hypothetical protein
MSNKKSDPYEYTENGKTKYRKIKDIVHPGWKRKKAARELGPYAGMDFPTSKKTKKKHMGGKIMYGYKAGGKV